MICVVNVTGNKSSENNVKWLVPRTYMYPKKVLRTWLQQMGIPVGILLGFGAVVLLLNIAGDTVESMVATMQSGVQIKAVANPVALLGAAGIAAATVILSSWIPSVKAARITPIAAIRQESEYQADKKLTKTARKWWKPGKVSANMAAKYYRTNRKKYRPIVTRFEH